MYIRDLTALLLLAACAVEGPTCGVDTVEADGQCVGEPPTIPFWTVEDVVAELEVCDLGAGDGRLDLDRGCADEVCVDRTVAQIELAMDQLATCGPLLGSWSCSWSNGTKVYVRSNPDGVADRQQVVNTVQLDAFDGTTADGLGSGVPIDCFLAALGMPDELRVRSDAGALAAVAARWEAELWIAEVTGQERAVSQLFLTRF